MKPIILYYSRSGNTEKIAVQAKNDLNCEAIKIVPEKAYGNYISACLQVTKEKKEPVAPAFVTPIPELDGFDTVLIGYPIWAQDIPRFVADFVEKCDLTGKTVIPFATYGMSGINWTMKHLQRICPGAKIRLPFDSGLLRKGNYDAWIEEVKKL